MDRRLDIRSVFLVTGLKMCIWQPEDYSYKEPASQSLMDILSRNSLPQLSLTISPLPRVWVCSDFFPPPVTEHITRIWSLLLLLVTQLRSPLGSPLSLKTCVRLFWALILHLEKVYCSLRDFSEFPGILHFHGHLSFQLPAPTEVLISILPFQSCSFSSQISTQRWSSALLLKIDFMFYSSSRLTAWLREFSCKPCPTHAQPPKLPTFGTEMVHLIIINESTLTHYSHPKSVVYIEYTLDVVHSLPSELPRKHQTVFQKWLYHSTLSPAVNESTVAPHPHPH